MFSKLIFLLQVTLSLKQEKIKELNPVENLVRSNQEKIRRGFKGFDGTNMVRNQSLRLRRLFRLHLCIIGFQRNNFYDPLAVFTLSLLLLKKLLLVSIIIIGKLMDDLLDELIRGN